MADDHRPPYGYLSREDGVAADATAEVVRRALIVRGRDDHHRRPARLPERRLRRTMSLRCEWRAACRAVIRRWVARFSSAAMLQATASSTSARTRSACCAASATTPSPHSLALLNADTLAAGVAAARHRHLADLAALHSRSGLADVGRAGRAHSRGGDQDVGLRRDLHRHRCGHFARFTVSAGAAWGRDGSGVVADQVTIYVRIGRAF